ARLLPLIVQTYAIPLRVQRLAQAALDHGDKQTTIHFGFLGRNGLDGGLDGVAVDGRGPLFGDARRQVVEQLGRTVQRAHGDARRLCGWVEEGRAAGFGEFARLATELVVAPARTGVHLGNVHGGD